MVEYVHLLLLRQRTRADTVLCLKKSRLELGGLHENTSQATVKFDHRYILETRLTYGGRYQKSYLTALGPTCLEMQGTNITEYSKFN